MAQEHRDQGRALRYTYSPKTLCHVKYRVDHLFSPSRILIRCNSCLTEIKLPIPLGSAPLQALLLGRILISIYVRPLYVSNKMHTEMVSSRGSCPLVQPPSSLRSILYLGAPGKLARLESQAYSKHQGAPSSCSVPR